MIYIQDYANPAKPRREPLWDFTDRIGRYAAVYCASAVFRGTIARDDGGTIAMVTASSRGRGRWTVISKRHITAVEYIVD